jgi:hypothetical protein
MTEIAASKEEIEQVLAELKHSIEQARKVRLEGEAFLRESEPRMERIRADLRRAGLLRD